MGFSGSEREIQCPGIGKFFWRVDWSAKAGDHITCWIQDLNADGRLSWIVRSVTKPVAIIGVSLYLIPERPFWICKS